MPVYESHLSHLPTGALHSRTQASTDTSLITQACHVVHLRTWDLPSGVWVDRGSDRCIVLKFLAYLNLVSPFWTHRLTDWLTHDARGGGPKSSGIDTWL